MPVERIDVHNTQDRLQAALHQARYDFAIERIPNSASVLEIGTGTGSMTAMLTAKCKDYTGVEIDAHAIQLTREKVGDEAKIVEADIRSLPFANGQFSHIVCLEVLEHIGNYQVGVGEIHRCLNSQGTAVISVPYRKSGGKSESNPYHLYEPGAAELEEVFSSLFEKVETHFQYFEETLLMTLSRLTHTRRLFGLAGQYRALTEGEPSALRNLRIAKKAQGMKTGVILVAQGPKQDLGA
jgi:ubiquinone/menaquinone biosynthesis C-methylase UbiE